MSWFKPRLPVADDEAEWLERNVAWLVDQFGMELVLGPVLRPGRDIPFEGEVHSLAGTRRLLAAVSGRMGVDTAAIDLEYVPEDDGPLPYVTKTSGAAGHYQEREGRPVITIYGAERDGVVPLVATIAHELAHVRLLGEGRVLADRRDGEPLTDLLTVVLGLGVFTANAAFDFAADNESWRTSRLGYLTEQMFGYALARTAFLRGEVKPDWMADLDLNPRTYMKQAMRYLQDTAGR